MADRHGRVLGEQEVHQRPPDERAPVDDHAPRSRERDLVVVKELHDPLRGAGHEDSPVVEEVPHVHSREAVDVLLGGDQVDHLPSVQVRGEGQLQDYPVHRPVRVEPAYEELEVAGGRGPGKVEPLDLDAELLGRPVLARDVHLRGRVVADEDGREFRLHPRALHHPGLLGEAGLDLGRQRLPVHDHRGHFLRINTLRPSIFSLPSTKSLTARG